MELRLRAAQTEKCFCLFNAIKNRRFQSQVSEITGSPDFCACYRHSGAVPCSPYAPMEITLYQSELDLNEAPISDRAVARSSTSLHLKRRGLKASDTLHDETPFSHAFDLLQMHISYVTKRS